VGVGGLLGVARTLSATIFFFGYQNPQNWERAGLQRAHCVALRTSLCTGREKGQGEEEQHQNTVNMREAKKKKLHLKLACRDIERKLNVMDKVIIYSHK